MLPPSHPSSVQYYRRVRKLNSRKVALQIPELCGSLAGPSSQAWAELLRRTASKRREIPLGASCAAQSSRVLCCFKFCSVAVSALQYPRASPRRCALSFGCGAAKISHSCSRQRARSLGYHPISTGAMNSTRSKTWNSGRAEILKSSIRSRR